MLVETCENCFLGKESLRLLNRPSFFIPESSDNSVEKGVPRVPFVKQFHLICDGDSHMDSPGLSSFVLHIFHKVTY